MDTNEWIAANTRGKHARQTHAANGSSYFQKSHGKRFFAECVLETVNRGTGGSAGTLRKESGPSCASFCSAKVQ